MKLCMIGTGYVGLVSGTCFSDLGNKVICADIDKNKINKLNSNKIPIYEPGLEELVKKNFDQKRLSFTTDIISAIKDSDIIFKLLKIRNSVEHPGALRSNLRRLPTLGGFVPRQQGANTLHVSLKVNTAV